MNVLHLEKGKFSSLNELFIGQHRELHDPERQPVKGGYTVALAIGLMLLAAGSVYFVEQARLTSSEAYYQTQLDEKTTAIESIIKNQQPVSIQLAEVHDALGEALGSVTTLQNKLTEATSERDVALGYISLLQNKLSEVDHKKDKALGHQKGTQDEFGLNP